MLSWRSLILLLLVTVQSSFPLRELVQADDGTSEYFVEFVSNKGNFTIRVNPAHHPSASKRFHELVSENFFDGNKFYRSNASAVRWGISGDPKANAAWASRPVASRPGQPLLNTAGSVGFAPASTTRSCCLTTQLYVVLSNPAAWDALHLQPFGTLAGGVETLRTLLPASAVDVDEAMSQGDAYFRSHAADLDYIMHAVFRSKPRSGGSFPKWIWHSLVGMFVFVALVTGCMLLSRQRSGLESLRLPPDANIVDPEDSREQDMPSGLSVRRKKRPYLDPSRELASLPADTWNRDDHTPRQDLSDDDSFANEHSSLVGMGR